MTSESQRLCGVIAVVATISAGLELIERDWLRGASGFLLAATFALIATGLPDRSKRGKLLSYAFLAGAMILWGVRRFGS